MKNPASLAEDVVCALATEKNSVDNIHHATRIAPSGGKGDTLFSNLILYADRIILAKYRHATGFASTGSTCTSHTSMNLTSTNNGAASRSNWDLALTRQLLAEFLGTALLLAVVAGSGIMAEQLAMVGTAHSAAATSAITGLALLVNSLATGAGLFVLIMLFGPVSGAHFNPVVSLVAMLQRQLSPRAFAGYVSAQILGGVCGILATHAMFNLALWQASTKVRSGSHLWWAEMLATFGLVLTIQGLSRRQAALPAIAASVALYIVAAYWFTASTSFANPAVTLARTFTDTFTGIRLQDIGGFILAQGIGALLALGCARLLFAQQPAT